MNDDRIVVDRMRFTKNTASSRLAILAIVFDVLYFISIYKSDVGTHYYSILIGASIVYNLVFLLVTFLASEGVKNYERGYSWLMIILGVLQIVRIFIIPAQMHGRVIGDPTQTEFQLLNMHFSTMVDNTVMGDWQFIRTCVYLIASAVCLFIGARVNVKKHNALSAHLANIGLEA